MLTEVQPHPLGSSACNGKTELMTDLDDLERALRAKHANAKYNGVTNEQKSLAAKAKEDAKAEKAKPGKKADDISHTPTKTTAAKAGVTKTKAANKLSKPKYAKQTPLATSDAGTDVKAEVTKLGIEAGLAEGVDVKMMTKNINSRAYQKARKVALAGGMDDAAAKELALEVGHKAVEVAKEKDLVAEDIE